jgi:hypothetical protein
VRVPFKVVKSNNGKDNDDDDRRHKGKDHDNGNKKALEITAPTKPVQAKPGDYMLFIVNQKGTPSMSKHIRLGVDENGNGDRHYVRTFKKKFPGEGRRGHGKDRDDDDRHDRDD